jgi:hypothetical protein
MIANDPLVHYYLVVFMHYKHRIDAGTEQSEEMEIDNATIINRSRLQLII